MGNGKCDKEKEQREKKYIVGLNKKWERGVETGKQENVVN